MYNFRPTKDNSLIKCFYILSPKIVIEKIIHFINMHDGNISLKYFSMFFLNSFLYITLLSLEVKINYIKGILLRLIYLHLSLSILKML